MKKTDTASSAADIYVPIPYKAEVLRKAIHLLALVLPLLAFSPWKTAQLRLAIVPSMWAFHLFGVGGSMNLLWCAGLMLLMLAMLRRR